MEKHITLLGILYIAMNVFLVAIAVIVYVVVTGAGVFSGELETLAITSGVASLVGLFLVLLSLPGIIGGIGLLKHKEWARILVLVLAFFNLINIPFGTMLAVYSFWVLMKDETIQLFITG